MRLEYIFDSSDELCEFLDEELSNADITLTHQPGQLRVYFDTPLKHSKYGGIFVALQIDTKELVNKLLECANTPGEVTLAERPSPRHKQDGHASSLGESLPTTE